MAQTDTPEEVQQTTAGQTHKKGRHRKKQLYNSILHQMEFYFSDSNLTKDRFLSKLIEEEPFVDLSVFLKCNKIRRLTLNIEDIQKAISKSEILELSEDKSKIRRKTPIKIKENVDECTIYVERIKSDATHEWLASAFSEFGNVVYVSIPKYKHNHMNKGFAFIEFEHETEAKSAIHYFESIGCKISSQLPPEELQSIATFEGDSINDNDKQNTGGIDDKSNNIIIHNEEKQSKKRKLSSDEVSKNAEKKFKVKDEEKVEDAENKKKTKKINKKKCQFKEMGLQVLSKKEWKKLRNRYLDMQKKKMKELKQHLNRSRFARAAPDQSADAPEQHESPHHFEQQTNKLEYTPGCIVKVKLTEPCADVKKLKAEVKTLSKDIKFVDASINNERIFIRFLGAECAKTFCSTDFGVERELLEGDEEKLYWDKIEKDRLDKSKKGTKQRGRDKLLRKAEKEFHKHIRFDDVD